MTEPTQVPPQGDPVVIGENEAKQGRRGLPILIVLVVSATLAAIATLGLWLARSGDLAAVERHNAREAADVADVDQPVAGARQQPAPGEGG